MTTSKSSKVPKAPRTSTRTPTSQRDRHPYVVGAAYLIRTVTLYYTGRLVDVYDSEFVLDEAAWIADTGRFSTALATGNLNEVEPMGNGVIVSRGGVIDVTPWPHALPNIVK